MLFRTIVAASLTSLATIAHADFVCSVKLELKWTENKDYDQLIIREGEFGTRAVLMGKYTTRTFDCVDDAIFKYECYGFLGTPTQLNVKDTKAGSLVISSVLNRNFLRDYMADGYEPLNTSTRRWSVDTYTIQACN